MDFQNIFDHNIHFSKSTLKGTWVAQLVKHPTLGFGSGHDLQVITSSTLSGSVLSMVPSYPSPSAPPCILSLK